MVIMNSIYRGGGNPGVKGARSLWEAGEEREESRIHKVEWNWEKNEFFLQHCIIFCNRKSTEAEPQQKEWEPGV